MGRLLRPWKKKGEVAIYRDPDWDEYIVVPPGTGRPRQGGESHQQWYHTDDKEDALDTAIIMKEGVQGIEDTGRKNPKVPPELINHWVKLTGIDKRELKKMADMAVELTRVASRHGEGGPLYAGQQYASYLPRLKQGLLPGLPYARGPRVRQFGEFLLAWGTPRTPRRKNTHLVPGEGAKFSDEYIGWLKKYGHDHFSKSELTTRLASAPHDEFEVLKVHPHGYTVYYGHPAPGGSHEEFFPDEALVSASSTTRKWPGDKYRGETPSDYLLGTSRENPAVGLPPRDVITRADYPSIFSDYDKDKIGDADDPHPYTPGDIEGIEEVSIADEIGSFIDTRKDYVEVKKAMMAFLKEMGGPESKVLGRVKSPFSIINKLRRKRLGTLTDIAATMVVLPDYEKVLEVVTGIEDSGAKIVEAHDFYATPNMGYRAFHFILELDGMPVEVQVKTARMKEIGEASHHPYKTGKLNAKVMNELTSFAHQADQGDQGVAADLDEILADPAALESMLTQ